MSSQGVNRENEDYDLTAKYSFTSGPVEKSNFRDHTCTNKKEYDDNIFNFVWTDTPV